MKYLDKLQLLHPIPKRALELGLHLIPCKGKTPVLKKWPREAIKDDLDKVLFWQGRGITEWAVRCGQNSSIVVFDVDFQKKMDVKKEKKEPCGPPIMGKITKEALSAGYRQFSHSSFEGQYGEHYFFSPMAVLDELVKGGRIPGTTIDFISGDNRPVRLYKPFPPGGPLNLFPFPSKKLLTQLAATAPPTTPTLRQFGPGKTTGPSPKERAGPLSLDRLIRPLPT